MGNIREAKVNNLEKLLKLLYQLSPKKENTDKQKLKAILEKIVKDENYYLCVFEKDDKLLGTATLFVEKNLTHKGRPKGHIENVVVDKNHRKKGVGKKLVDHLVEKSKEKNCYKTVLTCDEKNKGFYKKSGFKPKGINMRIDF